MNITLFLGFLFGFIFLLIGGIFLGLALYFRKKSGAAQSWPTAPGQIVAAKVNEHTDYDEDSGGSTTYEPIVEYRYKINGQEYTGRRIAFGANRFGHSQAQAAVARYPVGSSVQVRYNPSKPEEAVLEARAGGSTIFLIVGSILIFIAIVACCAAIVGAFLMQ